MCEVPAAECGSWADACDGACDGADGGCRSHCHATSADPLWAAAKEERRAASRLDDLVSTALGRWWTTPAPAELLDSGDLCPMCLAPLSEKTSQDEEYEYESDGDDGLLVQVRALTRCGGVAPIAIRSGCDNPRHAVHARCAKDWLYSATLKNDALKALQPLPKLVESGGRVVALNWRCPAGDCGFATSGFAHVQSS